MTGNDEPTIRNFRIAGGTAAYDDAIFINDDFVSIDICLCVIAERTVVNNKVVCQASIVNTSVVKYSC